MSERIDSVLSSLFLACIIGVGIISPWMFGAWETWWFWPFMGCLFAAGACYAARLMLCLRLGSRQLNLSTLAYSMIVYWAPFLIYAIIRAVQADVRMDAERSFLLQFSPVLLAIMVASGIKDDDRRRLTWLMLANMTLLAVYGIANYYFAGNSHVLWIPGFPQYQAGYMRATGTYFCPDHFSGFMELVMALSLALVLARKIPVWSRWAGGALFGLSLWSILLTRSRGGVIVVLLLIITAVWLCTRSWMPAARRKVRTAGAVAIFIAATGFSLFGGQTLHRFKNYPWTQLRNADRVLMSAAALRGWQSAPFFGIGPGMHQNLWPHFAPSSDGDRVTGRWPSQINLSFHSYEAHNDWVQLLEEYGVIGFLLFLVATGYAALRLLRRWMRWADILSESSSPPDDMHEWLMPGALLAGIAMAIHSLADFNLQMPATTWQLGILVGLAIATARAMPPNMKFNRKRHSTPSLLND
jgi:O-antigen ligase